MNISDLELKMNFSTKMRRNEFTLQKLIRVLEVKSVPSPIASQIFDFFRKLHINLSKLLLFFSGGQKIFGGGGSSWGGE